MSTPEGNTSAENRLSREMEVIDKVIVALQIERKLQEERDVWKMGEAVRTDKSDRGPTTITLTAKWPTYKPSSVQYIQDLGGNFVHPIFYPIFYPATAHIEPRVILEIDVAPVKRKLLFQKLPYFSWDGQSITVSVSHKICDSSEHVSSDRLTLNATQITEEDKVKFKAIFLKHCCQIGKSFGEYPLSDQAERDRQEIINVVRLGLLDKSALPANFDFSPIVPEPVDLKK